MAKMTVETEEARLTKKVTERRSAAEKPQGDAALRGLRKHLKRLQRKRRRLVMRKRQRPDQPAAAGASQPAAT